MSSSVLENAVIDDQVVHCTEVCKSFAILIYPSQSVLSHYFLIPGIVMSYFGIEVVHEDIDVSLSLYLDVVFCSLS